MSFESHEVSVDLYRSRELLQKTSAENIGVHLLIALAVFGFGLSSSFAAEKITVLTEQSYPFNYTENGRDDEIVAGFSSELEKFNR